MNSGRLQWIDGLKGLLAIWIIIFHYGLGFINRGYIGFSSNYTPEEYCDAYIQNLPVSVFLNCNLHLYTYLFLIAFIAAYKFYGDRSEEHIVRQAKVRYFRLMIPTFIACLINFILHHAGLLKHVAAGERSGVMWLQGIMNVDFSVPSLLYESLIKAYVEGSQFISVTWIMNCIFIGSYLSYAILMLFGKNKNRVPYYIGLFVFLFFLDQSYISFLMGIVAADIVRQFETTGFSTLPPVASAGMMALGLLLSIIPSIYLPEWLDIVTFYAIGAALIVIGITGCKPAQWLLERKVLRIVGEYSFSAILIHMPVFASVSCMEYLILTDRGVSGPVTVLIVFLTAVPVQIPVIFAFHRLTVPVLNWVIRNKEFMVKKISN